MGTDVFTIVETKNNNEWIRRDDANIDIDRNYHLFAIIGGVRVRSTIFHESRMTLPYFPLKGLPKGKGYGGGFFYDTYNHSWLSLKELNNNVLKNLYREMIEVDIEDGHSSYLIHKLIDIRRAMKKYRKEYDAEDVRIIFGFDC